MAVTAANVAQALRVDATDADELAIITRLLGVAEAMVAQHAPAAPTAVADEATIRIVGYLYDAPAAARSTMYGNALRNSGAASLLLPWRVHRARSTGDADTSGAADSPAVPTTPGAGLDATAVRAIVAQEIAAHAANASAHHAKTPPYVLPAAAAGVRGGVQAITNAILDDGSSTGIFGWAISHVRRLIEAVVPTWARNTTPPRAVPDNATAIGQFLRSASVPSEGNPGLYGWGNVRQLPSGGADGQVVGHVDGDPAWVNPPSGGGNGGGTQMGGAQPATWAAAGNSDDVPTDKLGALVGSSETIEGNLLPAQVSATPASRLATTASIAIGDSTFARVVSVEVDVGLTFSGFQPQIQVQIVFGTTVVQARVVDPDEDDTFVFNMPANQGNLQVVMSAAGGNDFTATLDVTAITYRHGTWAALDEHIEDIALREIADHAPDNTLHVSKQGALLHGDPEEQIDFQAPDWSILSSQSAGSYGGRRTAIIHPGLAALDANGTKLTPISEGMTSDGTAATGFPAQSLVQGSGIILEALAGGNRLKVSASTGGDLVLLGAAYTHPQGNVGRLDFPTATRNAFLAAIDADTYRMYVILRHYGAVSGFPGTVLSHHEFFALGIKAALGDAHVAGNREAYIYMPGKGIFAADAEYNLQLSIRGSTHLSGPRMRLTRQPSDTTHNSFVGDTFSVYGVP